MEDKKDKKNKKEKLADVHCHLDLIKRSELEIIKDKVSIMITNGTNFESDIKNLELSNNSNIFPALGLDPEGLKGLNNEMLNSLLPKIDELIRRNKEKIVSIGEIGLDYRVAKSEAEKEMQRAVFEHFIILASELKKPISIHSRDAIDDVIKILYKKNVERAHFHYFEGDENHARKLAELGYSISVPPIESSKRNRAIKALDIKYIMTESDAPAIGKTPLDVKKAIEIIADAKEMSIEQVADEVFNNARNFFKL